jgi:chemotaxis protein methyltransferase CheR
MKSKDNPEIGMESLNVSVYDETFLQSSIHKRIQATNSDGLEYYGIVLENDEEERKHLQKSLQVSYSEFFRNPLTFSVLEKLVLPELIQQAIRKNHNKLRIWSMACASGQEVYSLAMLLEEYLENERNPIQYQIFASDQSASEVDLAMEGHFTASALGNVNLKRLNRWFTKEKDGYKIKEVLRNNIEFSVFNLVSNDYVSPPESIYGDFDLIICANLLFYYKPEYQNAILEKAIKALANRGYLVTGEVERPLLLRNLFKEIYPFSAIFHKLP